jgi:hypothetical protein
MEQAKQQKRCPECGEVLKALLFLGSTPDGYVCERCEVYYGDELKPLARVLFCDGGET